MADRYWVGGTGTWNNSTTTNWAASSGGAGGETVPTSTDNVIFDSNSGSGTVTVAATAASANCTINQPLTFTFSGNPTFSGTVVCNGTSVTAKVLWQSSTIGTARTVTSNGSNPTGTYWDIQDITGAGSVTWDFSSITDSTAVGNCGNNSNITFASPTTQSFSGTGSVTWSTASWTSRVPLPQDTALINNAFSGSPSITVDMVRLPTVDFTGSTGTVTLSTVFGYTYYGSFTNTSNVTLSGGGNGFFRGASTHTITMAGKSFGAQISVIPRASGSYTLQDAFSANSVVTFSGNVNATSVNITGSTISISGVTGTLTSCTFLPTSTAATTVFTGGTSATSYITSNITISPTSTNVRTLSLSTGSYGTITYTTAGSTGGLDLTGSASIAGISFSDLTNARTLRFTAGTTTTIRSAAGWQVNGTATKLMTVQSITAATHTLSVAAGTVSSDYLNLVNSIAGGGATFYAGANSTDGGGNTGWIFTAPPTPSSSRGTVRTQSMANILNIQRI